MIKELKFSQLKEQTPYIFYDLRKGVYNSLNGYNIGFIERKEKDSFYITAYTDWPLTIIPTIKDIENLPRERFIMSFIGVLKEEIDKEIFKVFPADKNLFLKVIELHKEMQMEQLKPLVERIRTLTKLYSKLKD